VAFILDTDVAIFLRDEDAAVRTKLAAINDAIFISIITRVELEGGVYRDPAHAALRRARLDWILAALPCLVFDEAAAERYGRIVAHTGYSRRKLLDRMIAAQALVHSATLITFNANDYSDIPGLALEPW